MEQLIIIAKVCTIHQSQSQILLIQGKKVVSLICVLVVVICDTSRMYSKSILMIYSKNRKTAPTTMILQWGNTVDYTSNMLTAFTIVGTTKIFLKSWLFLLYDFIRRDYRNRFSIYYSVTVFPPFFRKVGLSEVNFYFLIKLNNLG